MVNCVDSRMGKLVKSYISSQQGGRIESFTDTEYQEHRVVEKVAEFYGQYIYLDFVEVRIHINLFLLLECGIHKHNSECAFKHSNFGIR